MNDKLQKLYDLYKQQGLIKSADFNAFANASPEQQKALYELGVENGLISKASPEDFMGAFEKPSMFSNIVSGVKGMFSSDEEEQADALKKKEQAVSTASPSGVSSSALPSKPKTDFEQVKAAGQAAIQTQPKKEEPKKEEPKKEEDGQGWLMNTASALDRGFYKNLIGNPVKGLGTLLEKGTGKVFGGSGKGPISDALINFGEYFNKTIDELAPVDEEYRKSLSNQFSEAFGQVLSTVLTGGVGNVGKTAAIAEMSTAAPVVAAAKEIGKDLISPVSISSGLSVGQSEFERAKQAGATDEQAFEAFYKNAVTGSVLEKIPVMQFLKRFNKASAGGVVDYLKTKTVAGLTGGTEEMTTEVLQQLYANKTAQDIYNVNQNLFEGVGESGGVGFGVGFLLNAMGANAKLLREQGKDQEASIVEAQINQFEQRAKMGGPSSYKVNGVSIPDPNVVNDMIENMSASDLSKLNVEITNDPELAKKIEDKVVTGSIKEQVRQANPELNEPSLNAITDLEKQLRSLEGNTTQAGKDKAAEIRSQIKEIQQNPLQEEVKVEVVAETPEQVKAREDRISLIESQISDDNVSIAETGQGKLLPEVRTDLQTELQTLKAEQDAIQKQAAGQVPVQPTAGGRQEMAQGEPQAEPEVTTQEGQAKAEEVDAQKADIERRRQEELDSVDISKGGKLPIEGYEEFYKKVNAKYDAELAALEKQSKAKAEEVVSPEMTLEEQVAALESMLTEDESAQFMLGGKRMPNNVTISDAIDEEGEIDYDAEEKVKNIAKDRGIGITRDREISFVARDDNNNVIGGAFTSYDGDKYTFDIVIDKEYDGKGVGSELLNRVVNIPYDILEQNPNATIEIDVVSPVMQEMLKKRGFEVTKQVSEGRVIMEPKNKAQFMLESQQSQAKQEMIDEATKLMEQEEKNGFSEKVFDATNPEPTVKPIAIEIKENTKLADKVKRMGLKELIGKKINLVMADQLKVGDVSIGKKILKRMGGPFFPLIDELFGKVAWASINRSAASSIVNGAIKSDYTVVYNMNPSAIDSNSAVRDTFIAMVGKMPKSERNTIVSQIVNQIKGKKFGEKTEKVQKDILKVKTLSDFEKMMSDLDVDTKAAIINMILPSKDVKAETEIGSTLQDKGITIESIREINIEQFVADLPAGALTMVIEVQDKKGNKITEATKEEAIITPEQQKQEGLPSHDNYPIYIRGKAVAILSETVPFWNILKDSLNTINVKVAKILKEKSGRAFTAKEARSAEMRSASMTANVARKASDIVATEYEKFVSLLSRAFPTVEVVANQKEFDNLISELGAKKLLTKNQNIYGAVYNGKVYLNPSLENYNTPIHEFGHIWLNVAKNVNPELYKKGLSLVSGSPYVQQIKDNKDYQRVIKSMMKEGASQSEIDTYIKEEALATAIGDRGESFVIAAQKKNFKEWLNKLYSVVRKLTGISKYTAEQLETITFDEFTKAVAVDLMSGNEIFTKLQVKEFSKQLQLSTGKKDAASIVKIGRASGFSDDAIRTVLGKKGFNNNQIDEAMKVEGAGKKIELGEELMPGYDKMMEDVDAKILDGLNRNAKQETILNNVMNLVRNSEAYKNATDQQREQIERDVKKAFGEKMKSAPSAKKVLGLKENVKKITMELSKYHQQRYEDMEKAEANKERDIKKASKELVASLKGLVRKGQISTRQMAAVLRKFVKTNVLSKSSVREFTDYMSKVFSDAEYADKLSEARKLRKIISKASKNKTGAYDANLVGLAVEFKKIDPGMVEDINQYNKMASELKEAIKGSSSLKGKMKFANTVKISNFNEYVEKTLKAQKEKLIEEMRQQVQDLLGIDASQLSYEEMVDKLNETGNVDLSKENEEAVRSAVEDMFRVYSDAINVMLSSEQDVDIKESKKELVKKFMKMDLSKMKIKDAIYAVDALNNFIINGSTAKMEKVLNEYEGQRAGETLVEKKIKADVPKIYRGKKIAEFIIKRFQTVPMMIENLFKGSKSIYFERISGIRDLISHKSQAQRIVNIILDSFTNKFYKLNPNGQKFNTAFNNIERDMLAYVTRAEIGKESESFKDRKSLIEQSIENLRKGNKEEQKKADIYQEVFDKILKDSKNSQEVRSKVDPINADAFDFWVDVWSKYYEDLADVSENIHNKILGRNMFYTPDKVSKLDAEESGDLGEDMTASAFHQNSGVVYKKKTGRLEESTLKDKLPEGSYINLSFDSNNASLLLDALVDIKTAGDVVKINAFLKSDSFKKVFPDSEVRKMFVSRMNKMILNFRGKNHFQDSDSRALNKFINRTGALSSAIALTSGFQLLKQTISVGANTMINGGIPHFLYNLDKAKIDFINNSGEAIAIRGTESQADINAIDSLISQAAESTGEKALQLIEKANKMYLNVALKHPDMWIAKASWFTYYEKGLRKQGKSTKNIDYSKHKLNKEAAQYAQKMVDRQQNISDSDLKGEFFSSKNTADVLLSKILFPLASFRINAWSRMNLDLRTIANKTVSLEDKKDAIRSLIGGITESIIFNSIGIWATGTMYGWAMEQVRGDDDDEEEKQKQQERDKKYADSVLRGRLSQISNDLFSPLPITDWVAETLVFETLDLIQDLKGIKEDERLNIFEPSDLDEKQDITSYLGAFGIGINRFNESKDVIEAAITGKIKEKRFGEETVRYVDPKDKEVLSKMTKWAALNGLGLLPADASNLQRAKFREIKKRASTKTEAENILDKAKKRENRVKNIEKIKVIDMAINEADDQDVVNELIKMKKETRNELLSKKMSDEAKLILENKKKREKARYENLLGGYNTKEDLKTYDPDLYEQNFGEDSQYYQENEAEMKARKLLEKARKEYKNEMYNYQEPPKKRRKRNSDGSYKRGQ